MSRTHIAFEGQIDYFVQHSPHRLDLLHEEGDTGTSFSSTQGGSFASETVAPSQFWYAHGAARRIRGESCDVRPHSAVRRAR